MITISRPPEYPAGLSRENIMELVKRHTVSDIFQIKVELLRQIGDLQKLNNAIDEGYKKLDGYSPLRLENRFDNYDKNREEKHVDRTCWLYLIKLFELQKYMLCTDYEKMMEDIDRFNFPVFTVENAEGYLGSLKDIIYNNVREMMRSVFERITDSHYYTGNGFRGRAEKKRNNNGIDKHFIITTYDYSRVFEYWRRGPSITDDLEKLCYILNGETLPKETIMQQFNRFEPDTTAENKYFKIKICKNGNTHYWIKESTRKKLNLYGADPSSIGEGMKIKVFQN